VRQTPEENLLRTWRLLWKTLRKLDRKRDNRLDKWFKKVQIHQWGGDYVTINPKIGGKI